MNSIRLLVCVNLRHGVNQRSCAGSGSRELIELIKQRQSALQLDFPVEEKVCLGHCDRGITMRIAPGGPYFTEVRASDIDGILEALRQFSIAHSTSRA